jgi:hypothetical protein
MTQPELNFEHQCILQVIQMYASGLITLPELIKATNEIKLENVSGLIDPATGLRLP